MSDKAMEFEDWYEENKMESMLDMSKVTELGAKMLMQVQAKQAWQAAKEQYAPQWISVEDSLPDDSSGTFLAVANNMPVSVGCYEQGYYKLNEAEDWGNLFEGNTAWFKAHWTHWMPIPQLGDKE